MPRMSLVWVEGQIEKELERGNSPDAVRDLAALLTVRDYLAGKTARREETVSPETEKKRMHDLAIWSQILKGED